MGECPIYGSGAIFYSTYSNGPLYEKEADHGRHTGSDHPDDCANCSAIWLAVVDWDNGTETRLAPDEIGGAVCGNLQIFSWQ